MRRTILFTMLATALCGPAVARPINDVTTSYYATAAKTTWVGSVELTCGGGTIRFGRTSRFATKQTDPCSLHRVSAEAMRRVAGHGLDRTQICHAICYRKFGRPEMCLPDGTCPQADALQECGATCDANADPATGNR